MVLILVPERSERLEYIFDFIFKQILKIEFALTVSYEDWNAHKGSKFSYGPQAIEGLHFTSSDLLFEQGVHFQKIQFTPHKNHKVFFQVKNGALPFDPFAAAFFLVSRYEEYLPHIKDRHNRYKAEVSTAYKGEFLEKPVVNLWAIEIKEVLIAHFPEMNFPKASFDIIPSIDIDHAYAYKNIGAWKTTSEILGKMLTLDFGRLKKRLKVITGLEQDPYDTYGKLKLINNNYNLTPCYYIVVSNKSRFDQTIPTDSKCFQDLIKDIATDFEIGLQASYHSSQRDGEVKAEKIQLENLYGTIITKNRFHYLKYSLPHSYRELIHAGIKEDHSMGYATQIGFRASTCTPFFFYDLEQESTTKLMVYPITMTDNTFRKYMHARPSEVITFMRPILKDVRDLGGHFEFVFHNASLGNQREWKNWGDTYENMVRLSVSK